MALSDFAFIACVHGSKTALPLYRQPAGFVKIILGIFNFSESIDLWKLRSFIQ